MNGRRLATLTPRGAVLALVGLALGCLAAPAQSASARGAQRSCSAAQKTKPIGRRGTRRRAHRGRRACLPAGNRRAAPGAPVGTQPPARAQAKAASAVGVHEHEFRITLTRSELPAGRVIVELSNEGEDPHNLELAPAVPGAAEQAAGQAASGHDLGLAAVEGATPLSFPVLRSGQRQTQALTLTPGVWRLWCSLPGHDAAGMHALLTVTG
jgi:hypothetical protein